MLKTFVATLFLIATLFVGCANAADNYLLSQAYFEDISNSLTLEEIEKEEFTSYDGWLAKGYRPSTYWIKLNIRPSDQDLILRIRPAYVETVQLFDPSNLKSDRITGAKYKAADADLQALNHNFNLGANPRERQIYLKVKSVRTYLLDFEVMPHNAFIDVENTSNLILVGYIVFILSLALWLLGAWLSNREIVLGMFVVQQFVAFLHAVFLYGYARIFFDGYADQAIINYTSYILVVGYSLIGVIATKLLFDEYSLKRFYRHLYNGATCVPICLTALLLVGYPGTALKLNASFIILIAVLFWMTSLFGTRASDTQKNINLPIATLRVYYTFNLVVWALVILPVLGVMPSNYLAPHYTLMYSVLTGLSFCWILQYRAKTILKNEMLKSVVLKKEVESERLRREDQGKLMSMLTHEIRTPLSVLKLVVDRKVAGSDLEDFANRAVSNIDSIIDKCIQVDQLDLNVLQINKSQFNFLDLLKSVIADTQSENRYSIQGQVNVDVETDPDIASIVIANLLGNAIKYSPPDTMIDIRVDILSDQYPRLLELSVQNLVGSMGAPDAALAFDKYYRSPSASKVSGSGLGLFLVRELVHALGGEVKLDTKENFIIFTVWIPI